MLRKALMICLALGLFFVINTSDKSIAAGEKYELRWGTITAGGAWQIIGAAMLEDVKKANQNITGSCVPSTTTSNVIGVHQGKFAIGFTLSDTLADAWEGKGYFTQFGSLQDMRILAVLYPQATQIVVWADSKITRVDQMKGLKVSPGAKGLSCDLELQRLLTLYGLSYKDVQIQFLSFEDAANQLIDNHIDVFSCTTCPFPFGPIINVNSQRQIRLLSIPDDKIAELTKFRGVEAYTLPPGLYKGVDYPVKGIAVRAVIIVRKDMPEEIAYSIVKPIVENYKRYPTVLKAMEYAKLEDVGNDIGFPFHPGAIKYYRERGLVK
jgi:TRAP transporter TAXI family solute receptor